MKCRHIALQAFMGLLCLGLVACGGGGGGGSAPAEPAVLSGNFFPLAVGDRWVYGTGSPIDVTVRATETRRVDGQDGVVVVTEDALEGPSEAVYVVSATSVRQVPASASDPLITAIGPLDVMRFPLHAGDSFVQIDKTIPTGQDFDGDGRLETATVRSEVRVIGIETVNTALASFAGALHQRTTLVVNVMLTGINQTVTVTTVVDDWYAPDIGPVRTTMAVTAPGVNDARTLEVVAYQVGTRRSDTVAPVVQSHSPAAGAVIGAAGTISVTFSEPMDAAALAGAFTLVGPAGQPVAASVQVDGSTATLAPQFPLGSGTHVARVDTAAVDRAGNALAQPLSWSFDVDVTGPVLAGAAPADGAADVALDARVVLSFNEDLDPASATAGVITFSAVGVGTVSSDVPFTTAVSGRTLTLTPTAPLLRAQLYEVRIFGGLRDLLGNAMASGVTLTFRADSGRFAVPVEMLAAGLVDAVAVGDVNGDGRADVVFTTGYTFNAAQDFKLVLRLQQVDGSLAAAQWLDTRAEYVCPARSVVIGDLDGDGRNDLLLGADGCGVQVFRQGSDGVLRAAEFLTGAASGRLRLADFNGDGRLDLAASGYYGTQLQVWRQSAAGTLLPVATPAFEHSSGSDLDVGDVNGDGRPDLVVTSGGGDPDRSIGIVLQNADGSFAPVQFRSPAPAGGVAGVAVGDVNGDGRADIVVTYGGNAGRVGVMAQQADGSLSPLQALVAYDSPTQVEVADINADGRADVLVGHNGWYAMTVRLQQPDGTLGAELRYPSVYGNFNPGAMAVGDVTGDGRVDVVVAEALLVQRNVAPMAAALPPSGWAATLRRLLPGTAGR